MPGPIAKRIVIQSTPVKAFEVFVDGINRWWPVREHSVSGAAGQIPIAVTLEPFAGGVIYETKYDGSRVVWGHLLDVIPGKRLAMTWHPGYSTKRATKLEIAFQAAPINKCRVTLVHSGWSIWGQHAEAQRARFEAGWNQIFVKNYADGALELLE